MEEQRVIERAEERIQTREEERFCLMKDVANAFIAKDQYSKKLAEHVFHNYVRGRMYPSLACMGQTPDCIRVEYINFEFGMTRYTFCFQHGNYKLWLSSSPEDNGSRQIGVHLEHNGTHERIDPYHAIEIGQKLARTFDEIKSLI